MARKKVQLEYISCDSARKATFKKRKNGLLKKIHELTTLCGVEACAVLYSPYDPEPVVWPKKEKALKVVEEFRQLPEMDQCRKMYDHPSYVKQRVAKANQQLKRLQCENCEREVELAMYGCLAGKRNLDGMNLLDLSDMRWIAERTLKEINMRLGFDNNNIDDVAPSDQVMGPVYANGVDMSMQMGPTMWTVEQYYKTAFGGYEGGNGGGSEVTIALHLVVFRTD